VDGVRRRESRWHRQRAAILAGGPGDARRIRGAVQRDTRDGRLVLRDRHAERDAVDGVLSDRVRVTRRGCDAGELGPGAALSRRSPHPDDFLPQGVGHSVGMWDGDKLAIDTALLSNGRRRGRAPSRRTSSSASISPSSARSRSAPRGSSRASRSRSTTTCSSSR
jgi:hypothetical protein